MSGCCACLNRTQWDGIIKSNPKRSKKHFLRVCLCVCTCADWHNKADPLWLHYDLVENEFCLTRPPPTTTATTNTALPCTLPAPPTRTYCHSIIFNENVVKKRCILRYMQIAIHQSICWSQNYHQRGRGCEVCNSPSTNGGLKLNPSSLINGKSATITWFV